MSRTVVKDCSANENDDDKCNGRDATVDTPIWMCDYGNKQNGLCNGIASLDP